MRVAEIDTVFEICQKRPMLVLLQNETFDKWFSNDPFERLYHCQKICNRMQGLQSQEALFGIARAGSGLRNFFFEFRG